MRIHKKIVIDIASGRILEEHGFDYDGPLARCDIITPLLFGSAAVAATGTAAAVPATAGLIGTAGAFSLGQTLLTGTALGSLATGIAGSVGQANASKAQADAVQAQYKMAERRQIVKDTETQAKAHAAGVASGTVANSGNPLELALDNMREAEMNAASINYQGKLAAMGPKADAQNAMMRIPGKIFGAGQSLIGQFMTKTPAAADGPIMGSGGAGGRGAYYPSGGTGGYGPGGYAGGF